MAHIDWRPGSTASGMGGGGPGGGGRPPRKNLGKDHYSDRKAFSNLLREAAYRAGARRVSDSPMIQE